MIYLIQGFFFQNQKKLGIGINHEGSAVFFKERLYKTMYAGIIYPDSEKENEMIGEMMDEYGKSVLVGVIVSDNKAEFFKQYEGRLDFIKYEMKRQKDKIWIGTYSGPLVREGSTQCILTKVPEEFLIPPVTDHIDAR